MATVKKKGLMSAVDKLYMPIEEASDNVLLATLPNNSELSILAVLTTYCNTIGGIYLLSFMNKDNTLFHKIVCLNQNDILKDSIYYETTSSDIKIYLKRSGVRCFAFLLARYSNSKLNNIIQDVPSSATLLY